MIVDTHVHVWEIDPPKYPVGPTAPTWNSYPDEPGHRRRIVGGDGCVRGGLDSAGADQLVHLG